MKFGIVALNSEKFFIITPVDRAELKWRQYKVNIDEFINIVAKYFPGIAKAAKSHNFDNKYSVANWLYNLGGDEYGNTTIIDNLENGSLYFDEYENEGIPSQFKFTKKTPVIICGYNSYRLIERG